MRLAHSPHLFQLQLGGTACSSKTQVRPVQRLSVRAVQTMTEQEAGRCYRPVVRWDPAVQAYLESALGPERLRSMSEALTRPPLATCMRVNTFRSSTQDVLARLPDVVTAEDRALMDINPPYIHPKMPDVIVLPGTGPHAIDYSRCTKEIVAGRRAGEAVMRGAHLFIPGILAASPGISPGDLVAVSVGTEAPGSETYGITRGWTLGSDPQREAEALADRQRMYIGYGRALVSRTQLFSLTQGVALEMEQRVFRTPGCGGLLPGEMMLQNLPSLVAAHVLGAKPGSRVLDMCAAPGGKTTAIAQLMQNQGEVIAFDRSHSRAGDVRRLAEEFGLTCVRAYKQDALKCVRRPATAGASPSAAAVAGSHDSEDIPASSSEDKGGGAPGAAEAEASHDGGEPCQHNGTAQQPQAQQAQQQQQQPQPEAANPKVARRLERIKAARAQRGQPPQDTIPGRTAKAGMSSAREPTLDEPFPPESFDYVLLDAPCSALGLRPRLRHQQTLPELLGTAAYQRRLLDTAVLLLRPGGTLVFSTCTINPGENEGNVRYVLDNYPCMQLVPQSPHLGGRGLTGQVVLPESGRAQPLLTAEEAALVQRFDPDAVLDTIGFFISKFEKTHSMM